jgi:hypothetical protein
MNGSDFMALALCLLLMGGIVKIIRRLQSSAEPREPDEGDEDDEQAAEAVDLEDQLEDLAEAGIRMNDGRSVEDLLISFPRSEYESKPYELLLNVLGGEVEAEPWGRRFSDDVWLLDAECIEGDGTYVTVAERLADVAKGALPLNEIRDRVDHEAGEAWLEFTLDGEQHRWEAKVEDDWIDPNIFLRFAKLLGQREPELRFMQLDSGDQSALIGAATPAQVELLHELTELPFELIDVVDEPAA